MNTGAEQPGRTAAQTNLKSIPKKQGRTAALPVRIEGYPPPPALRPGCSRDEKPATLARVVREGACELRGQAGCDVGWANFCERRGSARTATLPVEGWPDSGAALP